MQLMTPELREQLIANARNREEDHTPVVKFFNPVGAATWLVTEMDPDENDYLFGLADLGMGFPELGGISLSELQDFRGPLGLGIERDLYFEPKYPISVYAAAARSAQRIVESGPLLEDAARDAGFTAARRAATSECVQHHDAVREPAAPEIAVRTTAQPGDLPAGHNRHRDALLIVDPGACNPSGVALSLHNACRQVIAEGGDQRTDPAVRLIVSQLSYLTNSHADLDTAEYGALIAACKKNAGAPAP